MSVEVHPLYKRSSSISSSGHRTFVHTYQATTSDRYVSGLEIETTIGIGWGDQYPDWSNARVTDISTTCTSEDGCLWEATYTWTTDVKILSSPLLEPIEINWEFNNEQVPVFRDVNGKPIIAKNGLPFLDQTLRDDSRPILRIQRNEGSFPLHMWRYKDCINSDFFFGAPAKTVKFCPPQTQVIKDPMWGTYYRCSYEFHYRPETWIYRPLNAGVCEIGNDGKLKPIMEDGIPISSPVPLDWAGKRLKPRAQPVFLTFDLYQSAPFNPLFI